MPNKISGTTGQIALHNHTMMVSEPEIANASYECFLARFTIDCIHFRGDGNVQHGSMFLLVLFG